MENYKTVKKLIAYFLFAILLFSCKSAQNLKYGTENPVISNQLKWSERMALTLMKKHHNSYEIDDRTKPEWDYVHGLVMSSFEKLYNKTQNQNYFNYVKSYADATIDADGKIPSYKQENYNLDMLESGNYFYFFSMIKPKMPNILRQCKRFANN